jgi:tetratricopeptide (TPR) repeat protein
MDRSSAFAISVSPMTRRLLAFLLATAIGGWTLAAPASSAQTRTPTLPAAPNVDSVRTSAKAQALLVRGLTQAYVENYAGAIEQYEKALDHAPNAPALLAALAEAHAAQDDATSALYYARQAVRHGSDPTYSLQLADLQRTFDRPEEAAATYADVLDDHPDNLHALRALGEIQRELGRTDAAIDTYEALADAHDTPHPDTWTTLSRLYNEVGNADGVERSLEALIDQANDPMPHRLNLGRFYMAQDQLTEAEATFQALLRDAPGNAEAASQLVEVYERSGQAERADSLVQHMASADGGSPDELVSRAQYLLRTPSDRAAPDSARQQTARRLLQTVLEDVPSHPEALQTLGRLQFDAGQYAAAGSTLTKALEQNPRAPERWTQAARAYLLADQPRQALDVADEGLLLFPGQPALTQAAGHALALLGRPQESLRQYEDALSRTDSTDRVRRARLQARIGVLHRDLGDDAAADTALARAWELAPQEPGVAEWVAYDRAVRGVDLDQARTMAEHVLSLDASNVGAHHTLGWVHRQQGNLQAAEQHLRRAVETGPASPALLEHLGDVYQALGDSAAAQRVWQRALDRDPDRRSVAEKLKSVPK